MKFDRRLSPIDNKIFGKDSFLRAACRSGGYKGSDYELCIRCKDFCIFKKR